MCGRYRIKEVAALVAYLHRVLGVSVSDLEARFNAAPSQDLPVVALGCDDRPHAVKMRWGLVPSWEKSEKPKIAPINAQSETVATNGLFKHSVQTRRCLVPADGFYEWLRFDEKTKYAFDIHLKGGRPFVMAGIFESATEIRPATYAVLTSGPNELMTKIHDRMPAILDDDEAKEWLRPGTLSAAQIAALTAPHDAGDMEAIPISSLVNSPRNDVPEILEPVAFAPPPKPPKQTQGELF